MLVLSFGQEVDLRRRRRSTLRAEAAGESRIVDEVRVYINFGLVGDMRLFGMLLL